MTLWLQMRAAKYRPDHILDYFRIIAPPVPVEDIARRMGVHVHRVPRPGWDGAARSSESGQAHIWLNSDRYPVRQRFTLAHELGHLMLHDLGAVWRDVQRQSWSDPKEVEANQFAADLLMPEWMLDAASVAVGPETHVLADLFGVSVPTMKRRIGR